VTVSNRSSAQEAAALSDGPAITLSAFIRLMDDCGVMSAMTATNDGKRKFENFAEQSFLGAQGYVL
jgi:hypothetical protein